LSVDRRRFLQVAGIGAAGAALRGRATARALAGSEGPPPPISVTATLEDREIRLSRSGTRRFASDGVAVTLAVAPIGTRVEIEAPGVALRGVTLTWPANAPDLVMNDHWERTYGDVAWQKTRAALELPWYFLAKNGDALQGHGVCTGAASFASWRLADATRRLTLDTTTGGVGVRLGERRLSAAEIVQLDSKRGEPAFPFLRRFTRLMASTAPRPVGPVYGINDWYFAYGNNSDSTILEHTELMAPLADGLRDRPFSVIDAGWFRSPDGATDDCCFGPRMDAPNRRFRDMRQLAVDITERGMRPGIWTRPLCAGRNDPASLLLPTVPGRQDPSKPIFDPTIPENLQRVGDYFQTYRQWGYQLVKIDFTTFDILGKWGFEMIRDSALTTRGWRMHDVSLTNAEIIARLYGTFRAAAGDTCLIGCNTVGHLGAGVFEINRIGDDTSGKEWDRTRKMGVNTLAFRGAHHGEFYAADADCVGLTTAVPWEKNRQWMDLLAKSGTPLFVSAQPAAVGDEQRRALRAAFARASQQQVLAEPLDWQTNPWSRSWKLGGAVENFDWS
jgi:alpha-galactosidase